MNDFVLFGVLPYVAMVVFLIVTIQRYRMKASSATRACPRSSSRTSSTSGARCPSTTGSWWCSSGTSSGSSCPSAILSWNAAPLRLMALEVTGIAFAILTLVGLANIMLRRVHQRAWRAR